MNPVSAGSVSEYYSQARERLFKIVPMTEKVREAGSDRPSDVQTYGSFSLKNTVWTNPS
jgi:hypothetical protein